jgi:VanZ family protein
MKYIKLWLPVTIWAGIIFYLSNIPGLGTNLEYDYPLRKIAHIAEYFIFTLFLWWALKNSFNIKTTGLLIYPAFLSFLYAVSDEWHQTFVPTRSGSIKDVLIDAIGIIIFCVVIKIFAGMQKKKAS